MIIVETILLRALINLLMLGSVAGLIIGAILILRPHWLARAGLISNRWISTRHIDKALERFINIDPWFHRYRRACGWLTLVGAVFVLYFFSSQVDKVSAIPGLAMRFHMSAAYIGALFDPMVLIAILGSVFAILISLFMLFRPSLLRKFEHSANVWVSLRSAIKPLEILRSTVDKFTFRHTQQMGIILVLGSIYTLVLFTFVAR